MMAADAGLAEHKHYPPRPTPASAISPAMSASSSSTYQGLSSTHLTMVSGNPPVARLFASTSVLPSPSSSARVHLRFALANNPETSTR